MMRISIFVLVLSVLIILVGCTPQSEEKIIPVPLLKSNDTVDIRVATYNSCQSLIKDHTAFTGFVRYEECGKNCLGGCTNSGPQYCYYAIQDNYNCTIYVQSRIDSGDDTRFTHSNKVFRTYTPDAVVTISGNITMYSAYYCDVDERNTSKKSPACIYLVMEG